MIHFEHHTREYLKYGTTPHVEGDVTSIDANSSLKNQAQEAKGLRHAVVENFVPQIPTSPPPSIAAAEAAAGQSVEGGVSKPSPSTCAAVAVADAEEPVESDAPMPITSLKDDLLALVRAREPAQYYSQCPPAYMRD